ncbi:MAG: phosphatase PAP2 family protein [Armatimonadota bacterium]
MSGTSSPENSSSFLRRQAVIPGLLSVFALICAWLAFVHLDQAVVDLEKPWTEHPAWAVALTIATWLGSWQLAPLIALLVVIAARPHWRRLLKTLGVAYLLRTLVVQWMKLLIGRPRPRVLADATVFEGFGGGRSFPSGHASFAFMMAIIISAWFPRWRWPVWGIAIFVAISRVLVNAHFTSDIIVGALIGTVTGAVALWIWPPVTDENREAIEREERERLERRSDRSADSHADERRLAMRVLAVVLAIAAALLSYWYIDPLPGLYANSFVEQSWVSTVARVGNWLGTWELAPLLAAIALIAAGDRWRRMFYTLLVGYIIQATSTELVKDLFGRPRPSQLRDPDLFFSCVEKHTSFVSGHASYVFMFAVICGTYFPRVRIPAYIFAGFVAASRVAQSAHYPSDIIIGGLMGVLSAWIVLAIWPPEAAEETEDERSDDEAPTARAE